MLKHWFNKKWGKASTSITEWRSEQSIFTFLSANRNADGTLTSAAADLPDEQNDGNLRFAPGLADALFGSNQSAEDETRVSGLLGQLKRVATTGDKTSEYAFYQLAMACENVPAIIDAFLQAIVNEGLPVEPYLFSFAKDLATRSPHRNPVKFGIALLGLCRNKTVLDDITILGLHDEFTMYTTVAITALFDHPVQPLWQLAKKVDGWGKIQLVDRLANMELTTEIKDWLLLEGYQNNIMYAYLAYTCAMNGGLHEQLDKNEISAALFHAAGEIIDALLSGGPAEDINDYIYAVPVIENYIRHAAQHTNTLSDFLKLHSIKDFLTGLLENPDENRSKGWTQDGISNCIMDIVAILNRSDWKQPAMEALKSRDYTFYWEAKQAAGILGIDVWDTVWQRLTENPQDSTSWYDVIHYARPHHARQIIDFAVTHLPLAELATGVKDTMAYGDRYGKFMSLESVLGFLQNHPGEGEEIVLAGLRCPVTRTRNIAIHVLEAWKQEAWSEVLKREIMHLRQIEPNKDTRAAIERLLGK